MQSLQTRIDAFIEATGLPITRLCEKVEISSRSYYRWRRDEIKLKADTLKRIDSFLAQFNY